MAESKTSPRRIGAVEKQRRALDLRKGGATYVQIAQELGYKDHTAAVAAVKVALQKTLQEPADELRELECARLDTLLISIWPTARRGDLGAVDRVLKIMARRAELLGLDAPKKINVNHMIDQEVERIVAMHPDLPREEVRQRLVDAVVLSELPV